MHARTALLLASLLSCFAHAQTLHEAAKIVFQPLPAQYESAANPTTAARVELGRYLFFDRRLSKNQDRACASCHDLKRWGVDGLPTSPGHRGQLGRRNSQSVYNTGNHVGLFWDGRAATLEEQAKGPLLSPLEMAMPSAGAVEKVVKSIPGYGPLFRQAFPEQKDAITLDTITRALAAFERTLVTPSRFDAWLRGDTKALSERETKGLHTFMSLGCMVCHKGEGVGGGMYQELGFAVQVPREYLEDLGRFEVTKQEDDQHRFRVPSLRNIEKTGPYLHNGAMKTLEETVTFMARYQLGKEVSAEEVASIITFLQSLTGALPAEVGAPEPLPSGPDTPGPDAS